MSSSTEIFLRYVNYKAIVAAFGSVVTRTAIPLSFAEFRRMAIHDDRSEQ
jgi:hypothetical protein